MGRRPALPARRVLGKLSPTASSDPLPSPALLEPASKRQILARILNNLKSLYLSRGDLARALAASDRIMLADPHLTSEWRDRGLILLQLRKDSQALRDFSRYLGLRPEPEDAPRIKQLRGELISRLN